MKIGFIMDPIESVNVHGDTTFAFMLAAQQRGHEVFFLRMHELSARGSTTIARYTPCTLKREQGNHFQLGQTVQGPLHDLDVVFMRKDPPFDVAYLHACHLLDLAEQKGCLVVNHPRGLMAANEKLYTLNFEEVSPLTIVTHDAHDIKAFLEESGGRCILKPVDGHGGAGIFMLKEGDRNINAIIETSTRDGQESVICQQYVPEAREGDKRIILLDGEPLGGILRVPQEDDNRGNMHVGGSVVKTELTTRELEICEAVAPRLRADGLWFVGLDVIGGYLTEVNVTSPTGIQELSRFNDFDAAGEVIAWAEKKS